MTPTNQSTENRQACERSRHQDDLDDLKLWLHGIESHDEDEDGIAQIELFFKIRDKDEKMKRIYKELEKDDVIEILSSFAAANFLPSEGFDDDWRGLGIWGNAGFDVDWDWDAQRQGITLSAQFRT